MRNFLKAIRCFCDHFRCNLFCLIDEIRRRWRFRRICSTLKIRPYRWQRDFALGRIGCEAFPKGRVTGKTTAVMLRILMLSPDASQITVHAILERDPDWMPGDFRRCRWYANEYMRLRAICAEEGIKTVPALEQYRVWKNRR